MLVVPQQRRRGRMFKYLITLVLFLGTAVQAKTLSEVVLEEKLKDNQNYVFSNTSVDGLLSLISFGLSHRQQNLLSGYWSGLTLAEKAKKISALSKEQDGLVVSANYQVWLHQDYDFLPNYTSELSSRFSVVPEKIDVENPAEVVSKVNSWAAKNTNDLIKEVLKEEDVTDDLLAVLSNAIYFKGEWDEQFDSNLTSPVAFHGVGPVDTMTKMDTNIKSAWNRQDNVVVVELPFKGQTHSLIVVMSAKNNGDNYNIDLSYDSSKDIKSVFQDYIINSKALAELEVNGWEKDHDTFTLPKFEIESDINGIENKLSGLGLEKLFEAGALSNMVADPRAKISKIFQKAKIIVNEEGAEAAAVTTGMVVLESAISSSWSVQINGPFAYVIRDNVNQENLFEGVVLNPAK